MNFYEMPQLGHIAESEMKEILIIQERLKLMDSQEKCKSSFM